MPTATIQNASDVAHELAEIDSRTAAFLGNEIDDATFTPFRVSHGIYSQKQVGVQMVRIKVPAGVLRADQLDAVADIAARYSSRPEIHITTRQDLQLYFINLADVPQIAQELAAAGLTTRESGGNVVRNVKCCPMAGLHPAAPFDPTPYALAVHERFIRRDEVIAVRDGQSKTYFTLPRKFKIAFSGCCGDIDCGQAAINDVGLLAEVRTVAGVPVRGFQMKVGGGLSSQPRNAQELVNFVPADELLPWIEAVLRVFALHGNYDMSPSGRRRARLKHLIADRGWEWFRQEVYRVREDLPAQAAIAVPPSESADRSARARCDAADIGDQTAYQRWYRHATKAQRQDGFRVCTINAPEGNLQLAQARLIARVARKYGDGTIRLSDGQNAVIRWVREENVPHLYAEIAASGKGSAALTSSADVVSCPGADTCRLGITSSKGLAAEVRQLFSVEPELLVDDVAVGAIRIRVSGCPNGCGQHHIGTIGFHGGTQTVQLEGQGRQVPVAAVLLGGRLDRSGATFAQRIGIIPARRAADAVLALVSLYRAGRRNGESFDDWACRVPMESAAAALLPLTAKDSSDTALFRDAGHDDVYVFTGVGESECAK